MQISYKTYARHRESFENSKDTDGFRGFRAAQYKCQKGRCAWCYKPIPLYTDQTEIDHIVPVKHGGSNDYKNLVIVCHACNQKKGDSEYNIPAYERAMENLTKEERQAGFQPRKLYWERPKWFYGNKYIGEPWHKPEKIPIEERNVWNLTSPLTIESKVRSL